MMALVQIVVCSIALSKHPRAVDANLASTALGCFDNLASTALGCFDRAMLHTTIWTSAIMLRYIANLKPGGKLVHSVDVMALYITFPCNCTQNREKS